MPPSPDETLGAALRRLREGHGMGVRAVARLAGVAHGSVRDWESDRFAPSGPALDRMLDALEAPAGTRAWMLAQAAPSHARVRLVGTALGPPVDVGQVLRAMRLRQGTTQAEVARNAGVAQGTVAKWESGDSAPSGEALHRALFALGASPEEALALLAVEGRAAAGDLDDYEGRILRASFNVPIPLREVVLMGIESELWWRATRDPAAEALLGYAAASRAHQCLWRGALDEIDGHARRAIRIARRTGEFAFAAGAVYAAAWVRQRSPGFRAETASLRTWSERTQRPLMRKWLAGAWATAAIRAGDAEGGIATLEGLERDAQEESWARVVYHRRDLAEGLLLAGRAERARELAMSLGEEARPSLLAKVELALGNEPSPAVLAAVKAHDPFDHLMSREAAQIKAALARVRRGRPVRFV